MNTEFHGADRLWCQGGPPAIGAAAAQTVVQHNGSTIFKEENPTDCSGNHDVMARQVRPWPA